MERRYDQRSRYYFSLTTIIGNVLIEIAAPLYIGSLFFARVFPDTPSYVIIILLAIAAAAYTIPGGLSSVVHTEVIQAILLIIGSIILTYFTLEAVGGWDNVISVMNEKYSAGDLKNSPDDMLSLIRPMNDKNVPWTGLVFGIPILGFYFWANNQFMVQRTLSAKNLNHGRWGSLFAGFLKLPVLFIMVLPGTLAIAMPEEIFPALDNPDLVYPALVFTLLPTVLKGLVLAGLLAAMSSSISATLNSASTLVTMDFIKKFNPDMTGKQLVRSGQIATVVFVILAAIWAPFIERFDTLFEYLQKVLVFIAPPVVAAFLLGLFSKRANGTGAFAGFLFAAGFSILQIIFGTKIAESLKDVFPNLVLFYEATPTKEAYYDIHFLHIAFILFTLCAAVIYIVSLVTAPPPAEKIATMTWKKEIFQKETEELKALPWYKNYRILSIILLAVTAVIVGMYW
ncbi:MAG: sodium/solute symporter, partial [Bacteroidota bacterium]